MWCDRWAVVNVSNAPNFYFFRKKNGMSCLDSRPLCLAVGQPVGTTSCPRVRGRSPASHDKEPIGSIMVLPGITIPFTGRFCQRQNVQCQHLLAAGAMPALCNAGAYPCRKRFTPKRTKPYFLIKQKIRPRRSPPFCLLEIFHSWMLHVWDSICGNVIDSFTLWNLFMWHFLWKAAQELLE